MTMLSKSRRCKVRLGGVETGSNSYRKERLDRNASNAVQYRCAGWGGGGEREARRARKK